MDLQDLFLQFIERYHRILLEADRREKGPSGFPDITITQFFYLQAVQRQDRITLTELASVVGVSKPSATAVITRLISDGFITRTQSPVDQRRFHLSLTRKGREVFVHKQRAYREFVCRLEACTTEEQQELLAKAFRIMIESPLPDNPGN